MTELLRHGNARAQKWQTSWQIWIFEGEGGNQMRYLYRDIYLQDKNERVWQQTGEAGV